MKNKICVVLFTIAFAVSMVMFHSRVEANAPAAYIYSDDEIICQIEDLLTEGYQEYYDIDRFDTTICDDGSYFVEMTATLKADSVEELDYYRGAMQCISENSTEAEISSELERKLYDNFSDYIGMEQVLNFYVAWDFPKSNRSAVGNLMFEDGLGYVSAQEIFPPSRDELYNNGYNYMERSMENVAGNYSVLEKSAANSRFSVLNAVGYSAKYTSNPTSCNLHSNCGNLVDTTKYNPNYTHYAAQHSDCANFVSQTLCAGGIPTSTTWKAASSTWIGVDKLCQYMLDNGYWEAIDKNAAFVGDYIRYTGEQRHIVMITAHDGVSYRYSGHTNDRKNVVTSLSSSNIYYHVTY